MAVISKIFAALFTYPYQVVKSRMQTESKYLTMKYDGVFKTVSSIYRYIFCFFDSYRLVMRELVDFTRAFESTLFESCLEQ